VAEPEIWTVRGLLDLVSQIDEQMTDRSFAFVLGAGASKQSGIPTGAELVNSWLGELYRRHEPPQSGRSLEEWATAENLGITGFDHKSAATFYPYVFERRFRADPEQGYAYLESLMESKEPSFGYSVLAQILCKTRHSVVITTNFDDLVADALLMYTGKHLLVCGHEQLTGFVRPHMRRPLLAKIHRDLLLEPKNSPEGTKTIAPEWDRALRALFQHYTPLVIGYGGNDRSLLGFLRELAPGSIGGGLLWCYWLPEGEPRTEIKEVVARHNGALIGIDGFDELMLQVNERFSFELLTNEIDTSQTENRDVSKII